ncbi:thioredoxin family protein [Ectothiorhodospira lacustris]|uniref:thioredoxin family protein n=1 Tax=Ectothiorhodospira lacustris TaxID=2899127 RepID=UPI001EE9A436|nr:thioredoxin family protein [Ectothiorhodospira lacustris]MCG5510868.1 thioredoxin family protein [Ectothiorhodospira lacustris]MCG5522586.1 thioredoxin family protein [Ectothiorhodospira lacustris]
MPVIGSLPRVLLGTGLCLLTLLWSLSLRALEKDPYEHFFQFTFGDFQEELDTARGAGKKAVLIFFEMDECPFCHRMKDTVLNQPEVQDYYREHFAAFAVDVEGAIEITDFQGNVTTQREWAFQDNRVRATPVFQFFDLNGRPIARLTGPTAGTEEFLWFGEYVVEGQYREQPFSRYRRERQEQARGL